MPHHRTDLLPGCCDVVNPGRIETGPIGQRLLAHLFEIAAAFGWAVIGINYLMNKESGDRSSIGQSLPNYDIWWSACYVVGGLLVLAGLWVGSQRVRVAGLLILASGLVMQGIAAFAYSPLEPRDFLYWGYAVVCGIKAWLAYRDVIPKVAHVPPA